MLARLAWDKAFLRLGKVVTVKKHTLSYCNYIINTKRTGIVAEAQAVKSVNEAIDRGDHALLLRALQDPSAQLSQVYEFAGPLYQEELVNIKAEKQVYP